MKRINASAIALALLSNTSINLSLINTANHITTQSSNIRNVAQDIALKYESAGTDPSSINFGNIWTDIINSDIGTNFKKNFNIDFTIDRTNVWGVWVWYNGEHGSSMASSYENKIENNAIDVIYYPFLLSVIGNIAYYYGTNTSIPNRAANVKSTIKIIDNLISIIKTGNTILDSTSTFVRIMASWNLIDMIDDVLNQQFDNWDVTSKYLALDYSGLNTNTTLSKTDYFMSSFADLFIAPIEKTYHLIDSFDIYDKDDNPIFTVSLQHNFEFRVDWVNNWIWSFSNPTNYKLSVN